MKTKLKDQSFTGGMLDQQLRGLHEKLKKLYALDKRLTAAGCLQGTFYLSQPTKKKKNRKMYLWETLKNGKRKRHYIGIDKNAQAKASDKLARWSTRELIRGEIRDIEKEMHFLMNELSGLVKSSMVINLHLAKSITDFSKRVPAR